MWKKNLAVSLTHCILLMKINSRWIKYVYIFFKHKNTRRKYQRIFVSIIMEWRKISLKHDTNPRSYQGKNEQI